MMAVLGRHQYIIIRAGLPAGLAGWPVGKREQPTGYGCRCSYGSMSGPGFDSRRLH